MTSKHAYGAAVVLDDALYVLGGMEDMLESFKTSNVKVEDSFNVYNSKLGHYQCCAVLDFYEEPPVPVLKNKLEWFWFWFWFAENWNQESKSGSGSSKSSSGSGSSSKNQTWFQVTLTKTGC
jgi:hypothetical protein